MLTIDSMYIQVMDPSRDILICSDMPVQGDEDIERIIKTKMGKCFQNKGYRQAVFRSDAKWRKQLEKWQREECSLRDMTGLLANDIFQKKKDNGCYYASDIWLAEAVYEERRYLVIVDNAYRYGITHQVFAKDQSTSVDLIRDHGFYQENIMKEDCVVLIEKSDLMVQILEHQMDTSGQKIDLYADKILMCEAKPSYPQSVKIVTEAVETLVKDFNLNQNEVLPKMKQLLVDGTENQKDVDVKEMAEILFSQPHVQKEFHEKLESDGLPAFIPTAQGKAVRKERVQKLKTDNGIEIAIPIDYMNQSDYVDISHQEDGTITIRLKNINHIKSR